MHLHVEFGTRNPFYNPEVEPYVYEDFFCRNLTPNESLDLNKVNSYKDSLMASKNSLVDPKRSKRVQKNNSHTLQRKIDQERKERTKT